MKSPLIPLFIAGALAAAENPSGGRIQRVLDTTKPGSAIAVRVADGPLVHTGKLFAPDTSRDARAQADAVLGELAMVLGRAGSELKQVVKLNVYVADDAATSGVDAAIAARCGDAPPALTVVRSALERNGALVAMDAVAASSRAVTSVEIVDAQTAILPAGGKVYIAGQAKRADDLAASVAQTMEGLQKSLTQLGLAMTDVVHVKAFVTPMSEHATITREISRSFGGQRVPPIVMTEWVSTTPVEIELVVHGRTLAKPNEPVAYLPLPDMTTSPYYSRVTTVAAGTPLIFFRAVYSGEGGGSPREQWKRVFAQFGGALLDAGSSFRHLVKATYYLGSASAREALGEIRGVYYDPARPPSASAADVKGLGRSGMVMLDMIAVPAKAETRTGK